MYADTRAKNNEDNPLAPGWPFRLAFFGPAGCGKTNAAFYLETFLRYDNLFVCSKSVNGESYAAFRKVIEKREKEKGEVRSKWTMNLEDIPDPETLNKELRTLVIFDDMMGETNKAKEKIKKYYIYGRHGNASVITMMQSFTGMPPQARESISCVCIFRGIKGTHLEIIWRDFASGIKNKKNFLSLYQNATEEYKEQYPFLCIDRESFNPSKNVRFKFDCLLDYTTLPYSEDLLEIRR